MVSCENPHPVIPELVAEPRRDLLGGPQPLGVGHDAGTELGMRRQLGDLGPASPLIRTAVRHLGTVVGGAAVGI